MKYIDEFRDPQLVRGLVHKIASLAEGHERMQLMEVCGTHTMAIYRHGIRKLLPGNVTLLSGPGCPVCVTPNSFLDRGIAIANQHDAIITTFGDMMRVPGSSTSLRECKAMGRDVRVVYSTLDALEVARENRSRKVVFLGVGFETTAPTIAASIQQARREGLANFMVLSAAKTVMPAMLALVGAGGLRLSGFICPGHVTAVIGAHPYEPLASKYRIPCVIAGFEPLDVLQAISMIVEQVVHGRAEVEIAYRRVVPALGNPKAMAILNEVFEPTDSDWRGIGVIPGSGLRLRAEYAQHDASKLVADVEPTRENETCACGKILRGLATPFDCPLFGSVCTPEDPQGACMVSSEGTCAAAYRYGREETWPSA